MTTDPPERSPEADAELEREIRAERKFSLAEAIGRMAGPGAMKGVSPVTRRQQAEVMIQECVRQHLPDSAGVLRGVLVRQVAESAPLLDDLDRPLVVLASHVQRVLGSEYLLQELVRQADVEWGRVFLERPHFERDGQPADPDDPYTAASVRTALLQLMETLVAGGT